jgi:hypothetical protein
VTATAIEERVKAIMAPFAKPWRWFCEPYVGGGHWIVLEPPFGLIDEKTMHYVSQRADVHTVEAVFRSTPKPGIYLRFCLRDISNTPFDLAARAIKRRVSAFSSQRLNDGDDVWRERELELRSSVAATANAIAVEFAEANPEFDLTAFAAACGLYVSDGRDNYTDCHPGELTWERPCSLASKES